MGFFKNLFGKKGGEDHASDCYELENRMGLGDGSPLLIEKEPDLEAIFSSSKPPAPQRITDSNRGFWEDQPRDKVLLNLVMAYLHHSVEFLIRYSWMLHVPPAVSCTGIRKPGGFGPEKI